MTTHAWHSLKAPRVLEALGSSGRQGLSGPEAEQRLVQHGPNARAAGEGGPPLVLFLRQVKNTLVSILLAAIALSAVVGEVVDTAIIVVIVVFLAVPGFFQEYRAERAVEALRKMLAPSITVLRGAGAGGARPEPGPRRRHAARGG